MDYTKAIEISRDISAKMEVLRDEFTARIIEAYGEGAEYRFSCPIGGEYDHVVQSYPDTVSDGAVYNFSSDTSDFYSYVFEGEKIVECVRKKDDR